MTDLSTPLVGAVVGIGTAESGPEAFERAATLLAELLQAGVVVRWCPPGASLPLTIGAGMEAGDETSEVLQDAQDAREPVRTVAETRGDPLLAQVDADKAAVLSVPLNGSGAGGVVVARPLDAGEFTAADLQLAQALLTQADLALRRLAFDDERHGLQEELRTAERVKTEFVAMTSHELRTPLTSIRAATSMVRSYWDTIADDRKQRLLEVIEGQAQRLSRLVENILAAANIEAGVVLPRITSVDLAAAAEEVARDFAAELDVAVDVDRPLVTDADADHMRQILINFVGNSLKYGDPPVTISGRRVGDSIELRVTDEGPGVPREFVPRLFDRFTQASSGDSRHASGSGLGLSIVKGLAEASGGTVHYEPNEPRGSAFVLTLPAD